MPYTRRIRIYPTGKWAMFRIASGDPQEQDDETEGVEIGCLCGATIVMTAAQTVTCPECGRGWAITISRFDDDTYDLDIRPMGTT